MGTLEIFVNAWQPWYWRMVGDNSKAFVEAVNGRDMEYPKHRDCTYPAAKFIFTSDKFSGVMRMKAGKDGFQLYDL